MEVVVLVTVKDKAEAEKIAEHLVGQRLAACVNIINSVSSLFWWQGKLDNAQEVLLLAKTRKALFKKLEKLVRSLHSYDVPEIIALPIIAGSRDYLDWVKKSTK